MTSVAALDERREALIELIEWYRDEYHKGDKSHHNEMIEKIRQTDDLKVIEIYEQTVDGWLDY